MMPAFREFAWWHWLLFPIAVAVTPLFLVLLKFLDLFPSTTFEDEIKPADGGVQ